jgi:hypothetical protein
MSGTDATITIPSVRITQADGATLKANLGAGVTATLIVDPARRAGTDPGGHVLVYTPTTFTSGSSVSHFDVSAEPSLLMEPAITTGLSSDVDLTKYAFADLGWYVGATAVAANAPPVRHELYPAAPNPSRGSMRLAFSLAHDDNVDLAVYNLVGARVAGLAAGHMTRGRHSVNWDGKLMRGGQAPAGIYVCRLRAPGFTQSQSLVITR